MHRVPSRDVESLFLWDSDSLKSLKIRTLAPTPAIRSPQTPTAGLKADTDSWICVVVTAYWVNDADRQILKIYKNNNPILLRIYLNLISVVACSKMVHYITQNLNY